MSAKDTLERAASLVNGDRNDQHGDMLESFRNIAVLWNAWMAIRRDPDAALTAHDVAQMMSLLKKARTQSGAFNLDDYIDDAGYTAGASEVSKPHYSVQFNEAKRQGVPIKI